MTQVLTVAALILIGVLLFELIIFFHEGGHYLTAKKSGIKVNEFALGMGPKLFSFKKGETTYSFRAFPIGGYCAMEGEDEDSENPRAFNNAKIWKRMLVVIAGAVMNILLGFLLMFVIVIQQDAYASTTVDAFTQRSYSANSGLQQGDQIVKINNYDIYTSRDMSFAIATIPLQEVNGGSVQIYKEDCANQLCDYYSALLNGEKLSEEQTNTLHARLTEGCAKINGVSSKEEAYSIFSDYYEKLSVGAGIAEFTVPEIKGDSVRPRYMTDVTVIRDGKEIVLKDVDFFTYQEEGKEKPSVMSDFYVTPIEKNIGTVLSETFGETVSVVRMVWASLAGLVSGQFGFADVSGPIGVAGAVTQVASQGLATGFMDAVNNIILVMMIITVNLGIVNMLPFPALDGGRFVFLLIEGIFKKPVPRKVEYAVNAGGLALLMLFTLLISVKDVWQLFGG